MQTPLSPFSLKTVTTLRLATFIDLCDDIVISVLSSRTTALEFSFRIEGMDPAVKLSCENKENDKNRKNKGV